MDSQTLVFGHIIIYHSKVMIGKIWVLVDDVEHRYTFTCNTPDPEITPVDDAPALSPKNLLAMKEHVGTKVGYLP